jgi:hypothetical protein
MSIHQVCGLGSRRVVVRPSRSAVGSVQIEILGADRQVLAMVNIDAVSVGVLSGALELVANEAAMGVRDGLPTRSRDERDLYEAKYAAKSAEVA